MLRMGCIATSYFQGQYKYRPKITNRIKRQTDNLIRVKNVAIFFTLISVQQITSLLIYPPITDLINKYTKKQQSNMQDYVNKKVHPGQKLAKFTTQSLGYGLYAKDNSVYSSVLGIVQVSTMNSSQVYHVTNNFPIKRAGLAIGDIVFGKVLKVKEEECILEILQVNAVSCLSKEGRSLEGAIRKENVREKMIDSVVMIECFKPRDIVKAKVISLGDSLRGVYLTTAAQNLGVVVAENQETGRLMLPFDWTSMVDPEELVKQPRKVCKPE